MISGLSSGGGRGGGCEVGVNGGGKRGTASSDLGDMELVGSSILLLGRRLVLASVGKNNNSWIDVCMEKIRTYVCGFVTYVSIQAEEGIQQQEGIR